MIQVGDSRNDLKVREVKDTIEHEGITYYACSIYKMSAVSGNRAEWALLKRNSHDEIVECGNIRKHNREHYLSLIERHISKYGSHT